MYRNLVLKTITYTKYVFYGAYKHFIMRTAVTIYLQAVAIIVKGLNHHIWGIINNNHHILHGKS